MTTAQRALWLAQRLDPRTSYAIGFSFLLHGDFDVDSFRTICDTVFRNIGWFDVGIAERSEPNGGSFRLAPRGRNESSTVVVDVPDSESLERAINYVGDITGADLGGPLATVLIHRLSPRKHRVIFRMHHILTDGAGALRVMHHIAHKYAAETGGEEGSPLSTDDLTLPEPADLVAEDERYVGSTRRRRDGESLEKQLASHEPTFLVGPASDLSTIVRLETRPGFQFGSGPGADEYSIESDELIAAFASFCSRWTDRADIGLSLPVAARTNALRKATLSPLSNVAPLTLTGLGDSTAAAAVDAVATALVGALRRQHYRREDLLRNRDDLVDFGAVINILPSAPPLQIAGLEWQLEVLRTGPLVDVALTAHPADAGGELALTWEAPLSVCSLAELRDLAERFTHFLGHFFSTLGGDNDDSLRLDALFLPGEWEKLRARSGPAEPRFVATSALLEDSYVEGDANLPTTFDPKSAAVTDGSTTLTRAELRLEADRVARMLAAHGVAAGDRVATAVPRSVESVIAFWGIVRAGAVWVPIDPASPANRAEAILAQAEPVLGLIGSRQDPPFPMAADIRWLPLSTRTSFESRPGTSDQSRPRGDTRGPGDAAYVIFTSGSTGTPKGVVMPHRGIPALVTEIRTAYALSPRSRMLHVSSPVFDSGLVEVLSAAATGAALAVAPPSVRGGRELADLIVDLRISHIIVTPSVLSTLPVDLAPRLTQVVLGGEAVPPGLVAMWGDRVPLRNAYGPTETRCSINFSARLHPGRPVTVGPPMTGVTEAVLDRRGRPQPPGAIGVLYASGPQVADGYLHRPDLTAAAFLPSTIGGGPTMYCTGDLATWVPARGEDYVNELRVLGRRDGQVQIRGLRIELGEIDAALSRVPGVDRSATICRATPEGKLVLAAYVVPTDARRAPSAADLRATLSASIPAYMIPAHFVILDDLPRTGNDKLDVRALPAPRPTDSAQIRQQLNRAERKLITELTSIVGTLTVDAVDPDGSYVDAGGDSLSAVLLADSLSAGDFPGITVGDLYSDRTLAEIASTFYSPDTPRKRQGAEPESPGDQGEAPCDADPDGTYPAPEIDLPLLPAQRTVARAPGHPDGQLLIATWRAEGLKIPLDRVRPALDSILRRHDALSASYPDSTEGGYRPDERSLEPTTTPVLRPHPKTRSTDVLEVRAAEKDPSDSELDHIARKTAAEVDVRVRPPIALIALVDRAGVVLGAVVILHHVAVDGLSLNILGTEFAAVLAEPDALDSRPAPSFRRILARHAAEASRQRQSTQAGDTAPPARDWDFYDAERAGLDAAAWSIGEVRPKDVANRRALRSGFFVGRYEWDHARKALPGPAVGEFTAFRFAVARAIDEVWGQKRTVSATPHAGRPRGAEGVVGDFVIAALAPLDAELEPTKLGASDRRFFDAADRPLEEVLEHLGRDIGADHAIAVPLQISWNPRLPELPGHLRLLAPRQTRWLLHVDGSPRVDGGLDVCVEHSAGGLGADAVATFSATLRRALGADQC